MESKEAMNRQLAARRVRGPITIGSRYWAALRCLAGGEAVLDLGAGRGELEDRLLGLYRRVVAADILIDQISAPAVVEVVACDVDAPLPWGPNTFDAVVSLDVIEHVVEPVSFMVEISRVLRPGGQAVISTPNARALRHLLRLALGGHGLRTSRDGALRPWDGGHLHYFTSKDLLELCAAAGLATTAKVGTLGTSGRLSRLRSLLLKFASFVPVREFVCGGVVVTARKDVDVVNR